VPKPPLPARRRRVSAVEDAGDGAGDGLFVVAAPEAGEESGPASPVAEEGKGRAGGLEVDGDGTEEEEKKGDRESLRMLELQGS
jgi:hypothetical protein